MAIDVATGEIIESSEWIAVAESINSKIPDVVQDIDTKQALKSVKSDAKTFIAKIKTQEKSDLEALTEQYYQRNVDVFNARSMALEAIKKIDTVVNDFDSSRKLQAKEKVKAEVAHQNSVHGLTGTRYELNAARFLGVNNLTKSGQLNKTTGDKIEAAALQGKADLERDILMEKVRHEEANKAAILAQKEKELEAREKAVEQIASADIVAMQQQTDEAKKVAEAKQTVANKAVEEKADAERIISSVLKRIDDLSTRVNPDATYTGTSVLSMLAKISNTLKGQ
ncbi:hypothetical protein D9N16_05700 [Lactococcus raffinolactis]|uniref:hypothetical protein n=1 Tax=Pseudolactococcus raffinolactis TaxID=1366 RepID=UPI001C6FDEEE|nr:hypothetical protein [Lactococcus raffinolactis]MBW9298261.1 hypothetical protein [Lactococcus raffinolactis]